MFTRLTKPVLTSLLCATVLLAAVSARAAEISDGAKFFSPEAVTKANLAIHDVERKTRHEIRIETIATLPEDKVHAVSKMNASDRDAFFSNWVQDRAKETNSKGLVILICKKPEQIRLWAGKPLEHAGFGPAQAKPIRETILAGFKAHQFDKALNDTVTQIASVFEGLHAERTSGAAPVNTLPRHANNPPPAPAHHPPAAREVNSGYYGLIVVMVVVIGGVFLFSMISRMFSGSQSGYGPNGAGPGPGPGPGYGGGYGYGGGGFMKGIAGGIMGAVAGNWLYNQFSGGHQAHGSDSNYPGSSSSIDDNSSSSDSGFSGGTDYGGGDFGGGGDSGGDDFGGGDFGGGGD